jgi:zinc transport system substrate-binding protein
MTRGIFNGIWKRAACLLLLLAAPALLSCSAGDGRKDSGEVKVRVVASLYPIYDFAKNIGGNRAGVSLLLPPGEEPHSFEPRPADILNLNKADIFIYTNAYMEPWAIDLAKSLDKKKALMLDSSAGIAFMEEAAGHDMHDHAGHEEHKAEDHDHSGMDPHVWLDFGNAARMVDNITEAFIQKDPEGRDYYLKNAAAYKAALADLDGRYKKALGSCKHRLFINGGHFAFGYLAKRYGLKYMSAYGVSADSEPTPGQVSKIASLLKRYDLKYIYHEELLQPRMAETIAKETGAGLLLLHGAHNITREDFEKGVSFIGLMDQNLENLVKGLECSRM